MVGKASTNYYGPGQVDPEDSRVDGHKQGNRRASRGSGGVRATAPTALALLVVWTLVACQAAAPTVAPTVDPTSTPVAARSDPPATPTATPSAIPSPTAWSDATLAELLEALVVAPEHLDGYDRDLFPHWTDDDGDGCNTRREVLIAQAIVPPTVTGSCQLTGGRWLSPFDGVEIDDASGVQIDHLVALAEAWYSGAHAWTTDRRERFANDIEVPWVLVATSPAYNTSKGSSDPAEWLPPLRSARCRYVEAWIGTKVRWSLRVDPVEKAALDALVLACPDSRVTVPLAPP